MAQAVWSLVLLGGVLAVLGLYLFYDRPLTAPDWVEARIETRLAQEFPTVRITFGELRVLIEEGWRPRVRLRDIRVRTPEGRELVQFAEATAEVSMAALLDGEVQPEAIRLNGVVATLIRAPSGALSLRRDLALEGGDGLVGLTPGAAVEGIDAVLAQPGLAALEAAELRGLTLQFIDQRAEQAYTLDGGRVLARRTDGRLTITADLALLAGDGGGVTTLAANFASPIGQTEAEMGLSLTGARSADFATLSPAFGFLGALRAPISGNLRTGVRDDGTLAPLTAALRIGAGAVQPNDGTAPVPFDSARSYFTYDAAAGVLEFTELSVQSEWISATASGNAQLTGLRSGALQNLTGQIEVRAIRANPMALFEGGVQLESAHVDFALTPEPFELRLGELVIRDGPMTARAWGTLAARPDGWQLSLDARAPRITPARVLAFWPPTLKAKTRGWLADNLLEANISNADFALRLAPDAAPRSFLSFDFDEARVRVLRGLPPISRARGHASLEAARFVIAVAEGEMQAAQGGVLNLRDSAFVIPDTRVRPNTPAEVTLNTSSSLTAALWTLDQPPMRVLQRVGLGTDLGAGRAQLSGTLKFPLRRGGSPADVLFDVGGTLLELESDALIKGRRLEAPSLSLRATNTGVEIGGSGTLDGTAFDGQWRQPIGPGSARSSWEGSVRITPEALAQFGVALPPGTLSGATQAQVTVDLARGTPPTLTARSDLRGMSVAVPQIGWRKSANTAGQLRVDAVLGARPSVPRLSLAGAGLEAAGSVTLAPAGGLERLRLDRLRVGSWLDAPVDLLGQGAGRAPQVVVRGGRLDLRSAPFGGTRQGRASGDAGRGAPEAQAPMQVRLDRLQLTDTIHLANLRGEFKTAAGLDGPFQGLVNGGTAITGRVVPQNGRTALRVTTPDAGGVLRSAGVLRQAVGGALDLTLTPLGAGGAFDGRMTVKGVSIKDAPSMAALVNAVSVVGLVNEMNGDGIYFDEVAARFRLTPGRVTLSEGSAVGASLGISMDGVFATDTGDIAMQGVITPVYLLNGIGSVLTRKGEGLIGFNYSLGGKAKDPEVSINPLSALAPGGLRDAFRAPKTELPQIEGATPAPDAAPEPPARRPIAPNAGDR
ncbi:hypothetical protein KDD17_05360 [Sulfitobacter albidus]|uniref:DUF3971 domain-containing protein n=2 Tax=Sulfitobacter albidus TaxID=2829501 RepID=A0A975JGD1_9RHOB|nr:hypothetical protein KDD17_05360 [Sulfitobacter albidus]